MSQELIKQMSNLGVDWSQPREKSNIADGNVSIFFTTTPVASLEAGDEIKLKW